MTSVEDRTAYVPTLKCPEAVGHLVARDWPAAERAARDFCFPPHEGRGGGPPPRGSLAVDDAAESGPG